MGTIRQRRKKHIDEQKLKDLLERQLFKLETKDGSNRPRQKK